MVRTNFFKNGICTGSTLARGALAQSGRIPEAVAIANKMGELTAKGIYLGPNLVAIRLATPLRNSAHLDIFIEGLRKTGIPEEPE